MNKWCLHKLRILPKLGTHFNSIHLVLYLHPLIAPTKRKHISAKEFALTLVNAKNTSA